MSGSAITTAFGAILLVAGAALGGILWIPGAVIFAVSATVALRELRMDVAQRRHVRSKREHSLSRSIDARAHLRAAGWPSTRRD